MIKTQKGILFKPSVLSEMKINSLQRITRESQNSSEIYKESQGK